MKKKIVCLTVIFSILFSGFLDAEAKEVPKLTPEQAACRKKNYKPWVVAFVTVLVAATGLIAASWHKGKKAHSS